MAIGEVLAAMLGWLGEFISWIFSWVPRYEIVQFNEQGVRYVRGKKPIVLDPGMHWFVAATTEIQKHHTSRDVLEIQPLTLETSDEQAVHIGLVLTYRITDIYVYEVENLDAENNMAEFAQGALRDIVMEHSWAELIQRGIRFEGKLKNRLSKTLESFGLEVETVRPTDQVRPDRTFRLFND